MGESPGGVFSITWWATAIAVAVVSNLLSLLMQRHGARLLAWVSRSAATRVERAAAEAAARANLYRTQPHLWTRDALRAVHFGVGSTWSLVMAILGLELSAKLLEADLRNWPTFALAGGALAAIVVSGVLAQYALVLLLRLYPIHRDVGEPPDS